MGLQSLKLGKRGMLKQQGSLRVETADLGGAAE